MRQYAANEWTCRNDTVSNDIVQLAPPLSLLRLGKLRPDADAAETITALSAIAPPALPDDGEGRALFFLLQIKLLSESHFNCIPLPFREDTSGSNSICALQIFMMTWEGDSHILIYEPVDRMGMRGVAQVEL